MDNNTFVGMGALAFFDRYPAPDLLPVTALVTPSLFARTSAFVRRADAPFPRQVSKLRADLDATGGANDLKVVDTDHRIQQLLISPAAAGTQGAHHTLSLADCPAQSQPPVTLRLRSKAVHTSIATYYLPYALNEHRRITLADKQGIGNVDLFLTDIVDGCSVYVEGTAANPTVTHLNANSTHAAGNADMPPKSQAALRKAEWHEKTQQMNQRFHAAVAPKRVTAGVNLEAARRVDMKHYGLRMAADDTTLEASLGALQAANRAPVTVGGVAVATMEAFHGAGTIFGVRHLNLWSFHVQRRALVRYKDAGGTPLGMQWMVRDVQQFWPAAGAVVGKAA